MLASAEAERTQLRVALALMRQPYGSHVQKRSVVSKLALLRLAPADEVFGQPGGNTLKTFLHKPLESSVFRRPPSSSSASPGLSGGATASGVTGTTSRPGA